MAAELVDMATSEELKEMDWSKGIEICELVVRDEGQAKAAIKTIKKQLGKQNPDIQLFAVTLLEMLIDNCGEYIHRIVIDNGLLPILVKIVKKKTGLPVRERIFLLLDSTQAALGGASGKFPEYYAAYFDLVSAGVQFPQQPPIPVPELPALNLYAKNMPAQASVSHKSGAEKKQLNGQILHNSRYCEMALTIASIIQKAATVLDVMREVVNALDPEHPEGASDEFVLDLVEQCSFHMQRLMFLVVTSRDEKVVKQAIEVNEQLHKVLTEHDSLLSGHTTPLPPTLVPEEAEEEEKDHLFRRRQKGKACAEDCSKESSQYFRPIPEEMRQQHLHRLCIQPADSDCKPPSSSSIPPPPAKHRERQMFFEEKQADGSTLTGHLRGLTLQSRNGSSSHSSSCDSS